MYKIHRLCDLGIKFLSTSKLHYLLFFLPISKVDIVCQVFATSLCTVSESKGCMALLTSSVKSSWLEQAAGGLTSTTLTTCGMLGAAFTTPRYFASTPDSIHSGLICFMRSNLRSHSAGIESRFLASDMEDCRIPKKAASSAWVRHPAAAKTRSKGVLVSGWLVGRIFPYAAGASVMVALRRCWLATARKHHKKEQIAGS